MKNRLHDYLGDSDHLDLLSDSPPGLRQNVLEAGELSISMEELIEQLAQDWATGHSLIPDANIAIDSRFEPLWTMLSKKFTRFNSNPCLVTQPILGELREWLNQPWKRKALAASIRDGLSEGSWINVLAPERLAPIYRSAHFYYRSLLRVRRELALPRSGNDIFGRPYLRERALTHILRSCGKRAHRIATAGLDDFDRLGRVLTHDDENVILAFLYALQTGRCTTVLTQDWDQYEAFYKLQYLLDTHYHANRVAVLAKNGEYTMAQQSDANPNFEGTCDFYYRKTAQYTEAIPDDYASVGIRVILMSRTEDKCGQMIFYAVRDINKMLWTKWASGGKNTLQFPGRNLHITGIPTPINDVFAVGRDRIHRTIDGFNLSITDANIAIYDRERGASF